MARWMKGIRAARGLTQEKVAEVAGVSIQAVSAVERAAKLPTVTTLALLARGMKVPIASLLAPLDGPPTERQRTEAMLRLGLRGMGDREVSRLLELVSRLRGVDERQARLALRLWEAVDGLPQRDAQLVIDLATKIRKASEAKRTIAALQRARR